MTDFASSYVGQIRQLIGNRMLLLAGARIIIENDTGEYLLQQRSDFSVWGLLGGNAEPGESLSEVIVREVWEEAGIKIQKFKPFGYGSNPELETFTFPNGHIAQHFVMNFHCNEYSGTPTIGDDESLQIKWFSAGSLPEMLPNMIESIKAYQRFKESGEFQLF